MKVVKIEPQSVLIQDKNIKAWIDVWVEDEDVQCEWNQYIFNTNNSKDQALKKWQENNFEMASSLAIYALETAGIIIQDENGEWYNADDE
ncbi:MAG: hypothetical protein RL348_1128 [Bacteroidota bacterium]|jgi:ABC-type lipoprotein release transport system permease subunit